MSGLGFGRLGSVLAGAGLLALSFLAGCPEPDLPDNAGGMASGGSVTGGSGGSGGGVSACETACATKIFKEATGCGFCHAAVIPEFGNLDLVSPGYTSRLKDVPAQHIGNDAASSAQCKTGDFLIDTANPSQSFLWKKLKNLQGTCGGRMPEAGLPPNDLMCLETYISCVAGGKPLVAAGAGGSGGTGGTSSGGTGGGTSGGTGGGTSGGSGGGTSGGTGGGTSGGTGGAGGKAGGGGTGGA